MSVTENVLALPGHVSHSQVSTWSKCGRQYLLERVMRVETQPQGALLGGSAVHEAIETHIRDGIDGTVHFVEVFSQAVEDKGGVDAVRWGGRRSKQWPDGESFDWWLSEGRTFVERGQALYAAFLADSYELVSFEADYAFDIEGTRVVAKPDVVFTSKEGITVVVDWKTSSRPSPQNPIQICLYSLAVSQAHGFPLESIVGQVAMLRKEGADGLLSYNPTPYVGLAKQLIRDFVAGTQAGVFPMSPSDLCVACGVRSHCEYGKTLAEGGDE